MENLQFLTDEELILQFQNEGKNSAFEILVKRYGPGLLSYIFHILRNKEQAEDIFHDTLIKVMVTVRSGKYKESGRFLHWITRIAHNCMTDYFRHESDIPSISTDSLPQDVLNIPGFSEETIEEKIVQQQIYLNVRRMIRFLPETQQEIIKMRYYKGLTFKEIAQLTDVSINTALGRMHYAVLNMRKMIKRHQSLVSL
ncbi:MAG: sigma-70 family RNA polymerase sigma factor [Tannerellaceae bacterium]|nr:sigma-70 family RNA polymerase sigma factor [Tannerellaceae bacterium]